MSPVEPPNTGPFRGLFPFDESHAAIFFGRTKETAALYALLTKESERTTVLCGEPGVGKTSLLRAGLTPLLAQHSVTTIYLENYEDVDQEIWQALGRARFEPPTPGDRPADYLIRLARTSPSGTLIILDHLETLLTFEKATDNTPSFDQLTKLVSDALASAGDRLRVLLCVDPCAFHRLGILQTSVGLAMPLATFELGRMGEEQTAETLEETILNTGTIFEDGLSKVMANDLCQDGPCLPAELQIAAVSVFEERLTSLRRYQQAGGASMLLGEFLPRRISLAGGQAATRVLMACAELRTFTQPQLASHSKVPIDKVEKAVAVFLAHGLVRKIGPHAPDGYRLTHPYLEPRIRKFSAATFSQAEEARRWLRRRVLSHSAPNLFELRKIYTYLTGTLRPEETAAYHRGIRRLLSYIGIGFALMAALLGVLIFELRTSYSLAYEPNEDSPTSRVVVTRGRNSLSFLHFIPATPPFGSILADTGFTSSQVATELSRRILSGHASGTFEKNQATLVPAWMRTILDSLGPVQRGVSLVLLGDPGGVVSLKQAFADPVLRREALEALAVVGRGRAGEDEILSAALNDASPDVRRRGVEVAAAIDRRIGKGMHATILRTALSDSSFSVRSTALHEGDSLDPNTAGSILAVALADRDISFRRLAEKGILKLSARAPAAAALAVRHGLGSTDSQARRTALALLDQITAKSPKEATSALHKIASDESASEETRITVLSILRRSGEAHDALRPMLEKAVGPDASPRLRTAALPIYARLIDPVKVEELAIANSKGPSSLRATGAALWGVLAISQPEVAAKPLKAFLYDTSSEVRMEATRAFGYLKREGPELVRKAILDPNIDVQRAAVDSTVRLAAYQPSLMAEDLGRAILNVRPASRQYLVEALGQIGQTRPLAVLPPLARALKTGDVLTRTAAARAICDIAPKAPSAVAIYLRVAARDTDRDVRAEAAACLGRLSTGDPKAAARMAAQLTLSEEVEVRKAAATSLGSLAKEAKDLVLSPLILLVDDRDRTVRLAAIDALFACQKANLNFSRYSVDLEKKLSSFFGSGENEDRQLALRLAAKLSIIAVVRQAARDSDATMRLLGIKTAAAMSPPVLDILQTGADDRDAQVRTEAVRALAMTSETEKAKVLPVFETMLRAGNPDTRRAGAIALGEFIGSPERTTALLATVLHQRSVAVRAAATQALSRIAKRAPRLATPLLELALTDSAYDVRSAAIYGLGAVWATERSPSEMGTILTGSEADSVRRMVALEALVLKAKQRQDQEAKEARRLLESTAEVGPPMARLAAQVGCAFLAGNQDEMHAFLEKLFGG